MMNPVMIDLQVKAKHDDLRRQAEKDALEKLAGSQGTSPTRKQPLGLLAIGFVLCVAVLVFAAVAL